MKTHSDFDRAYEAPAGAIIPGTPATQSAELSLNTWGFRDTRFEVDARGQVSLSGQRYSLCGQLMDRLLPWAEEQLGVSLRPGQPHVFRYPQAQAPSRLTDAQLAGLRQFLGADALSVDPLVRLRHGHGHSQEDIWAVNYGTLPRIPDAVAYPDKEEQVGALFQAANSLDLTLIPFGGGTNVTGACRCPADEERPIISVDMSRMNRVRWIDAANGIACIEAGATGQAINETLSAHGFTLGHEPDSYELSTLGGWIATHASGMKKNRYGNIENIVLDFRTLTPSGRLLRSNSADRESIGLDFRKLLLGAEGRLGIITQALVRIHPLPAEQQHESIIFPDFEHGLRFFQDLQRSGVLPASIRLMENRQFILGQCLKPSPRGLAALKSRLQKAWLRRVKGLDLQRIAACTVLCEGSARELREQRQVLRDLMRRHGGVAGGADNGRQGYSLTFAIAYLRDFLLTQWIIGESFETTVAWSRVSELCQAVQRRVEEGHRALNLPGRPFLSYRLTQAYHASACLYFYMGFYYRGVDDPSGAYGKLEHLAREAILDSGGSLSHHHGIGKLRADFLPRIVSPEAARLSRQMKAALDPDNLLVCGNQGA